MTNDPNKTTESINESINEGIDERIDALEALIAILGKGERRNEKGECTCKNCTAQRETETLMLKAIKDQPLVTETLPQAVQDVLKRFPNLPKIAEWEGPKDDPSFRNVYNRVHDTVCVHHRHKRRSINEFCRLLFHELIHATGAKTRLGRKMLHNGLRAIATEELIAERGAQRLLKHCGLYDNETRRRSESYIITWADPFFDNEGIDEPEMLASVEPEVRKAVKYALGIGVEKEPTPAAELQAA